MDIRNCEKQGATIKNFNIDNFDPRIFDSLLIRFRSDIKRMKRGYHFDPFEIIEIESVGQIIERTEESMARLLHSRLSNCMAFEFKKIVENPEERGGIVHTMAEILLGTKKELQFEDVYAILKYRVGVHG